MILSNFIPKTVACIIIAIVILVGATLVGISQTTSLETISAEQRNATLLEAGKNTLLAHADSEYFTNASEALIEEIDSYDLMGNGIPEHYYDVAFLYNPQELLMNMPYLAVIYFRSVDCTPVLIEYGTGFASYLPYTAIRDGKYAWWTLDGWLRQHYGMVNHPEMGEATIKRLREEIAEQQLTIRKNALATIEL